MIPEVLLFSFALLDNGALLFILVYYVITLSDLECDYLNPLECCSKLNFFVPTKLIAHGLLSVLLLFNSQWVLTALSLPLLIYLLYEYLCVRQGNLGVYDPTEIHNKDQLWRHMRDVLVYLLYYLISFFIYLYCLIIALLKGDPIQRHHDDKIITEL